MTKAPGSAAHLAVLLAEGAQRHVADALGDAHQLDVEGVAEGERVVVAGQPQPLHPRGHLVHGVGCWRGVSGRSVGGGGEAGRQVCVGSAWLTSASTSSITCCSSSGWMCDSAASTPSAPVLAWVWVTGDTR